MSTTCAINGFGRIGRRLTRLAFSEYGEYSYPLKIDVINDPNMTIEEAAYLFKYDTEFGRFTGNVEYQNGGDYDILTINGKNIRFYHTYITYNDCPDFSDTDYVIDCTGTVTSDNHVENIIRGGAKQLLLTYPPYDVDIPICCPDINDLSDYSSYNCVSLGSCTLHAASVVYSLLNTSITISESMMHTFRSFTNDQELLDTPKNISDRFERDREASNNIVPTTTSAGKRIEKIIPALNGKVLATAHRAPLGICGSITFDVSYTSGPPSLDSLKYWLENTINTNYKDIIEFSEDDLVSSDVKGSTYAITLVANRFIKHISNRIILEGLYDNETGFCAGIMRLLNN